MKAREIERFERALIEELAAETSKAKPLLEKVKAITKSLDLDDFIAMPEFKIEMNEIMSKLDDLFRKAEAYITIVNAMEPLRGGADIAHSGI